MDLIFKLLWVFHSLAIRPFFGRLPFNSYVAPLHFAKGLSRLYLGQKVRVFPGARFEIMTTGRIHIGDDCSIGGYFHCTAAGDLTVGTGTTILARVFITDIDHEYEDVDVPILDQPTRVTPTSIGSRCYIGIGACIQAGSQLGDNTIVGANAVVRGKFPNGCVLVGAPARVVKRYHPRRGWEKV